MTAKAEPKLRGFASLRQMKPDPARWASYVSTAVNPAEQREENPYERPAGRQPGDHFNQAERAGDTSASTRSTAAGPAGADRDRERLARRTPVKGQNDGN